MTDPLLTARDLALVDEVARRVIELLDARAVTPPLPRLVDADTLAAVLGVSRDTVYQHRTELGARRVGNGTRPRLRFDVAEALAAWTARQSSESSQPSDPAPAGRSPRWRQRTTGSGVELLPIGGRKAP